MTQPLPATRQPLQREIAAALVVKIVLLWALWHLAFRHGDSPPAAKPDIAALFRPPAFPSTHQEASHVR